MVLYVVSYWDNHGLFMGYPLIIKRGWKFMKTDLQMEVSWDNHLVDNLASHDYCTVGFSIKFDGSQKPHVPPALPGEHFVADRTHRQLKPPRFLWIWVWNIAVTYCYKPFTFYGSNNYLNIATDFNSQNFLCSPCFLLVQDSNFNRFSVSLTMIHHIFSMYFLVN